MVWLLPTQNALSKTCFMTRNEMQIKLPLCSEAFGILEKISFSVVNKKRYINLMFSAAANFNGHQVTNPSRLIIILKFEHAILSSCY